jgi:hypothetical protein
MEDTSYEILESLKAKSLRLISLYEKAKGENGRLLADKQEMTEEIHRQHEMIKLLEDKNKKLQLAEAFKVSSADTNDAKLKIGRIVKEIDKCIALLNR